MITKQQAELIVKAELDNRSKKHLIEVAILNHLTKEFEFGWVFFYQSVDYIKSKDTNYMLGGNAPIIVDKYSGLLHNTGTGREVEYYIDLYCKSKEDSNLFHEKKNE